MPTKNLIVIGDGSFFECILDCKISNNIKSSKKTKLSNPDWKKLIRDAHIACARHAYILTNRKISDQRLMLICDPIKAINDLKEIKLYNSLGEHDRNYYDILLGELYLYKVKDLRTPNPISRTDFNSTVMKELEELLPKK
jgi:hypothetical protein